MGTKEYWESFSDKYADEITRIQPQFYFNAGRFLNKALDGCDKVIDIGNSGVINYDASKLEELVCADLSLNKHSIDKFSKFSNIRFIEANVFDMPHINDATFDAIILQTVIHHLAGNSYKETLFNINKALLECIRILKPGGKLLLVESTVNKNFELLERALYPIMQAFFKICKFDCVYQFSPVSLLKLVDSLNLKVMNTEMVVLDKYIWIMRRKVLTSMTPCGAIWIEIHKPDE